MKIKKLNESIVNRLVDTTCTKCGSKVKINVDFEGTSYNQKPDITCFRCPECGEVSDYIKESIGDFKIYGDEETLRQLERDLCESINEDVPMEYTDSDSLKALADEDEYYNEQRARRKHNLELLHKIFDSHGYRDSEERWTDKVFDLFRNAEEITVVDDASKVPSKTNDGQKVRYVFSTPDAEVDVHVDVYGDYVWVVTKQPLNEDLSGKYSDKFRQFIRNYTDSATIVGLVDDIVRYAKEDDLRDLYFERGYDALEDNEVVDYDLTESLNEDVEDVQTVQRYLTSELPDILLELSNKIDNIYDCDVDVLLKNCRSFYNLCESMVRYYNRHSNLEEDLTDVATATLNGPTEGPQFGLTELINTAMQNELETVNEYNTLALNARTEGFEDIANVIDEINTEENKHIGQLQELLKTISPNAQAIEVGNVEGTQQLSEALSGAELKDIGLVLTQIFTKESNGEKADTISKIIELIPEDLVDDVINLIGNKLSSIEIENTDKDKIKSLANSDADLSNSHTLGEIFKLINIDEFANENPGLIKTFLTTVLGIIAAIEPTPVLEVVTFIVGILPENLLVKLLAIINPFVGMLKLGSKLLSKKWVKEDIETVNNSNKTPNTNDEEVLGEDTVEDWSTVYNKFKQIEQEMNGDGEAITAIIDNMYNDNKGNPSYEKAYSMWLKDTIG